MNQDKITYTNVYLKFKELFAGHDDFLNKTEKENRIDPADGSHVPFEMAVVPFLLHLADIGDEESLRKAFAFLEQMATSEDKEVQAVLQFSVLEPLADDDEGYAKIKKYLGKETLSYLPYLRQYLNID